MPHPFFGAKTTFVIIIYEKKWPNNKNLFLFFWGGQLELVFLLRIVIHYCSNAYIWVEEI